MVRGGNHQTPPPTLKKIEKDVIDMMETKNTKKTLKDYFNEIITLASENGRDDLVEFCNERIEMISRKNSSRTETKVQKENKVVRENLLSVVSEDKHTSTEITNLYNTKYETNYSNNKIAALLSQLVREELITRIEEKSKAYFSKVSE